MARNEAGLDEVLDSLGLPERRSNRVVDTLVERGSSSRSNRGNVLGIWEMRADPG